MKPVVVQEFRFELPDGFEEVSVDMWGDGVDRPASRYAIVATRRSLAGGSVDQLIDRDLAALGPAAAVAVLDRRATRAAGQAASDVRIRAKPAGNRGLLYERIVAIAWNGAAVAWTAASEMRDRVRCDAHLDEMLSTTRLRKPG